MGGKQPQALQHVDVPVLSNGDCRSDFKYHHREITDNMFCAGYYDGRHDACMVGKNYENFFWQIGKRGMVVFCRETAEGALLSRMRATSR